MIHIVLPTYNGARWVAAQIESIQKQTRQDWRLLVSDDGSTDGTIDVIAAIAKADGRIQIISRRHGRSGHVANFEYLLREIEGLRDGAVFLSDQDDIWYPEKLRIQCSSLEDRRLSFSNLDVIDRHGQFKRRFHDRREKMENMISLGGILGQNPAPGCTMSFRSALLELALPFPDSLVNHDWWLLLCASCTGGVRYIQEPLVGYRQHGDNVIGGGLRLRHLLNPGHVFRRQGQVIASKILAVRELVSRLEARGLSVPAALEDYLYCYENRSSLKRSYFIVRGRYAPKKWSSRLAQVLAALFCVRLE